MPISRKAISFRIQIKRVEKPFSDDASDEFRWLCESLGFFEPIDRSKTASSVFQAVLQAAEKGEALSSTEIAHRVDMSRGAVINHLSNLLQAGLITKHGRFYFARSRSMFRTLKEIEEDILRVFREMEETAREFDARFGSREE